MSDKIVYPYLKSDGFVRPCRRGCPNCTLEEYNQMKRAEDERIVMSLPPLPW